jgi:hypothetical protein
MKNCEPLQFLPVLPIESTARQGLTLVHFSPQGKRFEWHRECIQGLLRGNLGGGRGYYGVYQVSETAQVELKSKRM